VTGLLGAPARFLAALVLKIPAPLRAGDGSRGRRPAALVAVAGPTSNFTAALLGLAGGLRGTRP